MRWYMTLELSCLEDVIIVCRNVMCVQRSVCPQADLDDSLADIEGHKEVVDDL